VLWHCWLGDRNSIWPVKSWILAATIWLQLCASYSSSCHHHCHHPQLQYNPEWRHSCIGLPRLFWKMAVKRMSWYTGTKPRHTYQVEFVRLPAVTVSAAIPSSATPEATSSVISSASTDCWVSSSSTWDYKQQKILQQWQFIDNEQVLLNCNVTFSSTAVYSAELQMKTTLKYANVLRWLRKKSGR